MGEDTELELGGVSDCWRCAHAPLRFGVTAAIARGGDRGCEREGAVDGKVSGYVSA